MLVADVQRCRREGRPAWLAYIRDGLTAGDVPEDSFCVTYATRLRLRPWNKPTPSNLDDYTTEELEQLAFWVERACIRMAEIKAKEAAATRPAART